MNIKINQILIILRLLVKNRVFIKMIITLNIHNLIMKITLKIIIKINKILIILRPLKNRVFIKTKITLNIHNLTMSKIPKMLKIFLLNKEILRMKIINYIIKKSTMNLINISIMVKVINNNLSINRIIKNPLSYVMIIKSHKIKFKKILKALHLPVLKILKVNIWQDKGIKIQIITIINKILINLMINN